MLSNLLRKEERFVNEVESYLDRVIEKDFSRQIKCLTAADYPSIRISKTEEEAILVYKRDSLMYIRRLIDRATAAFLEENNLTPRDLKQISSSLSVPCSCLSKRANRFVQSLKGLKRLIDRQRVIYQMLAPHTFCFLPFDSKNPKDKSDLVNIVDENLTSPNNFRFINQTTLRAIAPHYFHDDNARVDLTCYLRADFMDMKIKMVATRTEKDKTDKMDIEARFVGNNFAGICHYDLEKPVTFSMIQKNGFEVPSDTYHLEIAASPKADRIFVRYGNKNDKKTVYKRPEEIRETVYDLSYWSRNPVMAGGEFLAALIETVASNPKFEALQHWALRQH